jgi:hypothetical protein
MKAVRVDDEGTPGNRWERDNIADVAVSRWLAALEG